MQHNQWIDFKVKKFIIILIEKEQGFAKVNPLLDKSSEEIRNIRNILRYIKGIYDKHTTNIMLNMEKLRFFSQIMSEVKAPLLSALTH